VEAVDKKTLNRFFFQAQMSSQRVIAETHVSLERRQIDLRRTAPFFEGSEGFLDLTGNPAWRSCSALG